MMRIMTLAPIAPFSRSLWTVLNGHWSYPCWEIRQGGALWDLLF